MWSWDIYKNLRVKRWFTESVVHLGEKPNGIATQDRGKQEPLTHIRDNSPWFLRQQENTFDETGLLRVIFSAMLTHTIRVNSLRQNTFRLECSWQCMKHQLLVWCESGRSPVPIRKQSNGKQPYTEQCNLRGNTLKTLRKGNQILQGEKNEATMSKREGEYLVESCPFAITSIIIIALQSFTGSWLSYMFSYTPQLSALQAICYI